jgi:hypothetical protein
MDFGLAIGAVVVRMALGIGGVRAALLAPALCACVLLAVLWRHLKSIDTSATIPHVQIQLLRSIPMFAALPAPSLEGVARELVPVAVPSGTVVIREGDRGDRYYAIADGRLTVSQKGTQLRIATRGDGFGEIALIRDEPRMATVTSLSDTLLYSLEKEPFLETITGHAPSAYAARTVITQRLAAPDSARSGDRPAPRARPLPPPEREET